MTLKTTVTWENVGNAEGEWIICLGTDYGITAKLLCHNLSLPQKRGEKSGDKI